MQGHHGRQESFRKGTSYIRIQAGDNSAEFQATRLDTATRAKRERGHGTHAHLAHSVRGPCCHLYRPSYGMINDRNPAAPLDPGDRGEDDVEMTQANAWLRPFQSVSDDKAPSNVTTITFSCAGIAKHDTELARVLRTLPCPACCHSNHCGYQTLRAFTYSILE